MIGLVLIFFDWVHYNNHLYKLRAARFQILHSLVRMAWELGVGTQHFLTICLWHTIFVDGGCYFCWCRVNVDHVGLLALQELSKEPILLQLENLSILVNNSLLIVITWLATYNSKFFPGLDSFSSCKPSCVFFNHPYWKKKKLQALHLFP